MAALEEFFRFSELGTRTHHLQSDNAKSHAPTGFTQNADVKKQEETPLEKCMEDQCDQNQDDRSNSNISPECPFCNSTTWGHPSWSPLRLPQSCYRCCCDNARPPNYQLNHQIPVELFSLIDKTDNSRWNGSTEEFSPISPRRRASFETSEIVEAVALSPCMHAEVALEEGCQYPS